MQIRGRDIVRDLDPLHSHEDILAEFQIAGPIAAVAPEVDHEHTQLIGNAVLGRMEELVVFIPARDPREPVDAMRGPRCPRRGNVRHGTCSWDDGVGDGIIVRLVGIMDVIRRVSGEDFDVRFADGGVVGENTGAGTWRRELCVAVGEVGKAVDFGVSDKDAQADAGRGVIEVVDRGFDFGGRGVAFAADGAEDEEGRVRPVGAVWISGEEDIVGGVDHGDRGDGGAAPAPRLRFPEASEGRL